MVIIQYPIRLGLNYYYYQKTIKEAQDYEIELEYEKAEQAYLEAIEKNPQSSDAYLGLTDLYLKQYKTDEASTIINQAK